MAKFFISCALFVVYVGYTQPKCINRTPLRYWIRFFRCHRLLYVLHVPEKKPSTIHQKQSQSQTKTYICRKKIICIGNSNMIYFPPRWFTVFIRAWWKSIHSGCIIAQRVSESGNGKRHEIWSEPISTASSTYSRKYTHTHTHTLTDWIIWMKKTERFN